MNDDIDEIISSVRAEASDHHADYAAGMRMACIRIREEVEKLEESKEE